MSSSCRNQHNQVEQKTVSLLFQLITVVGTEVHVSKF